MLNVANIILHYLANGVAVHTVLVSAAGTFVYALLELLCTGMG